jgi:transcriptional regulator GlxA family with amidase domain
LRSTVGYILGATIQEDRFTKILERVESGSVCNIRDLARECSLSTSHLQHLFKAHTGTRLGHALAEQRLRKAASLLLQRDISVKEVAYAVGYKHPSSFVRAFTRFFHMAPSDYRHEMLMERHFS